jgi:hypothetical protein
VNDDAARSVDDVEAVGATAHEAVIVERQNDVEGAKRLVVDLGVAPEDDEGETAVAFSLALTLTLTLTLALTLALTFALTLALTFADVAFAFAFAFAFADVAFAFADVAFTLADDVTCVSHFTGVGERARVDRRIAVGDVARRDAQRDRRSGERAPAISTDQPTHAA